MQPPLNALLSKVLSVAPEEIDSEASFETISTWDSAREVEIALELEQAYHIALDDKEMSELSSLRQIRSMLAARGVIV